MGSGSRMGQCKRRFFEGEQARGEARAILTVRARCLQEPSVILLKRSIVKFLVIIPILKKLVEERKFTISPEYIARG